MALMVDKQTSKSRTGNILTDNAVTRSAGELNKQAGAVGKEVEQRGKDAEKMLRPLQRVMAFTGGVLRGGAQGMSKWARIGARVGAVVGIAAMIMTVGGAPFLGVALGAGGWTMHGLGLAIGGWAAGLIAGAVAGGIVGAIKGGPYVLALEERKAKYADELAIQNANNPRTKARGPSLDKAAYNDFTSSQSDGSFDRFQQRFDLAAEDTSASWADRVTGGTSGEISR